MMESGWTADGIIINGSANAAMIVNIPAVDSSYFLEFSILAECTGIAVQQWDGASWIALGTLEAWGTVAVIQLNENEYYDVSSDAGMNIRIRFTSSVVNLSKVTLWTSQRTTDVGTSGDADETSKLPGVSIYDNAEWSSATTMDGRTIRTTASTSANFYLNGALSDTSYAISITYKTSVASVSIQQYLSSSSGYVSLGTLTGDNAWHTSIFYTQVSEMYDNVAGGPLNILFQIYCNSGTVAVDSIAMCMDRDGDGISDAMESIRVTMTGIGTHTYDLNPFSADTDSDGLNDDVEITSYGTDPTDEDSDDDGLLDGSESFTYAYSSDSFYEIPDSGSVTVTVVIPSITYSVNSINLLVGITHPDQTDIKIRTYLISSLFATTVRNNGIGSGPNLYLSINLLDYYSTSDFILGWDMHAMIYDMSGDGDTGRVEYVKVQVNGNTDPLDSDSDNDGILDGEEVNFGVDGWYTNPKDSDSDMDGVSDPNEISGNTLCGHATNPTKWDTDNDGTSDLNDRFYGDAVLRVTIQSFVPLEKINGAWSRNIFFVITYNGDSICTKREYIGQAGASLNWEYDIDVSETATYAVVTFSAVADDAGWLGDDIRIDVDPGRNVREFTANYTLSSTASTYSTSGDTYWLDMEADGHMDVKLQLKTAEKANVIIINGTGEDGDYGLDEVSTGGYRYSADDQVYMINLNVASASTHFQQGMNTIILPRAVALQCELNYTLSHLDTASSDLSNASFYYADDGVSSSSSHVIAVITKDVTASEAENILLDLTFDHDGVRVGNNVSISSDDLYLLDLPNGVISAIPTFIKNEGMGYAPNYLDPVGIIEEVGEMVFNFLVCVYDGAVYVIQQIARMGMELITGATGLAAACAAAVLDAVNEVVDALVAFVDWVIAVVADVINGFCDTILWPAIQAMEGFYFSVSSHANNTVEDNINLANCDLISVLLGDFLVQMLVLSSILNGALFILTSLSGGMSFIISTIATTVALVLAGNIFGFSPATVELTAPEGASLGPLSDWIEGIFGHEQNVFDFIIGILNNLWWTIQIVPAILITENIHSNFPIAIMLTGMVLAFFALVYGDANVKVLSLLLEGCVIVSTMISYLTQPIKICDRGSILATSIILSFLLVADLLVTVY